MHIHNDDDFCKLFNALISAYKFCAFFFPLPTNFEEILTKKWGKFWIYIIFLVKKIESKFKHVEEKIAKFYEIVRKLAKKTLHSCDHEVT